MIPRDVGKLWGEVRTLRAWAEGKVREFEVVLTGQQGDNGLRGNIRDLAADVKAQHLEVERVDAAVSDLADKCRHFVEVDRYQPGGCLGVTEVKKLRTELDKEREKRERESQEMQKLRIGLITAVLVAMLTTAGNVAVALINKRPAPAASAMTTTTRVAFPDQPPIEVDY